VIASVALAGCLLFLTNLLRSLPTVVLAAIVLVAVRGLIDLKGLRFLRRVSRREFRVAMFALVGVLLFGILKGVLLAAIVSLVLLLAGAATPGIAFLGRIPGTRRFSSLERHPDNESIAGVVIVRPESSLLYFNSDHVRRVVWDRISATPDLRLVICDLSNSPMVDVAGANMLADLHSELAKRNARIRVVEAHAKVRDLLRAVGLEEKTGYLGRHLTIEQVLVEEASRTGVARDPLIAPPDDQV
jgi:MFS superfamily sulfate permease-like transporter